LEALLELGLAGGAFTVMIIAGVISAAARFRHFGKISEAFTLAVICVYAALAGFINMYYTFGTIVFLTHILLARLAFGQEPPTRGWRPL
jgi:hypothetical protein